MKQPARSCPLLGGVLADQNVWNEVQSRSQRGTVNGPRLNGSYGKRGFKQG